MEDMRLNRYLAECGICSRRDADKLIESGKVQVNGKTAQMGMRIAQADMVTLKGKKVQKQTEKVVLAYYKKRGVTCTEKDVHAQKILMKEIDYPLRVTYAGRLDRDSEGLLLLTNDGDLIQKMMKASEGHEKEYLVKVDRPITKEFLNKMSEGVFLPDLGQTTRKCRVVAEGKKSFRIILTQGLNRQIRRMCDVFSYQVTAIKRIRVLNIRLDDLRPGTYRELTLEEKQKLYQFAEKKQDGLPEAVQELKKADQPQKGRVQPSRRKSLK